METIPITSSDTERRERPPVLYHASADPNIKEFTPRRGRSRDPNEGPVIFAAKDKSLASMFLVADHNDSWTTISYFDNVPVMVIRANQAEFTKKDRGGTIYSLASDTFDYHPNRGMKEREWTSSVPVKPHNQEFHPSALESMIENGVQVYFVDDATFKRIDTAQDHGHTILLSLQSVNEERGLHNPLRDQK